MQEAATLTAQQMPGLRYAQLFRIWIETRGTPDVTPNRLHISRRYGSPFHQASRMEDGRLAAAGLLACGSDVSSRPSRRSNADRQWHMRKKLAAYSCGSSLGFDNSRTEFPFSPLRTTARSGTVARVKRHQAGFASTAKAAEHLLAAGDDALAPHLRFARGHAGRATRPHCNNRGPIMGVARTKQLIHRKRWRSRQDSNLRPSA